MDYLRRNRMEEISKLDPNSLKSFVRHVCVIAKKHKDREIARSDMYKQMQKLKKFSSKKKEMDEELKELNSKISLVLEKEAQLLGTKQGESAASKELIEKTMENKAKIEQIYNLINEVNERVRNYTEIKTERERKIKELEKKIRTKSKSNKQISLLKNKLKALEATYNKLKNKGLDVSRVAEKIEALKLRLSV